MSQELAEAARKVADNHADFARSADSLEASLANDAGALIVELRDQIADIRQRINSLHTNYAMEKPSTWCNLAAEAAEAAETNAQPLNGTRDDSGLELISNVGAAVTMAEQWAVSTTDSPWRAIPASVSSNLGLAVNGLDGALGALRASAEGIKREAAELAQRSAIAADAYTSRL